ncbi:MAG: serpin family protein, partial [Bacteroidota bacterium]
MNIKKLFLHILMLTLLACNEDDPIVINEPGNTDPNVGSSVLPAAMKDFSQELFVKVLEQEEEDKNIVVSPLSVAAALYMTYNGADGSTQKAMSDALALNNMTVDTLNSAFETLSNLLQQTTGNTSLNIA